MSDVTPLHYNDYQEATKKILTSSQQETQQYTIHVCNKTFTVLPGVFSPKYFHDTSFFAEILPITPGEVFLEIWPGTGIISVMACYKWAKQVFGVDINPLAVQNSYLNAKLHGFEEKTAFFAGDLYTPLPAYKKYDTIFRNTPFGDIPSTALSDLEKAVFDPGYTATRKFIQHANQYLSDTWRLLIGFSSTLGKLDLLTELVHETRMSLRTIAKIDSSEEYPVSFELFEAKFK